MAVCTDLKVVKGEPVVTVADVTFVSHDEDDNCVQFISCEQNIADVAEDYVSMQAAVTVENADAKFKIKSEFKKDGVSKSYTTAEITQSIGEIIYCLTTNELYVVANYTNLTMTIINLVPA